MTAHASVVTEASTSSGWSGWMTTNMRPATIAATPVARTIAPGEIFIGFLRQCARQGWPRVAAVVRDWLTAPPLGWARPSRPGQLRWSPSHWILRAGRGPGGRAFLRRSAPSESISQQEDAGPDGVSGSVPAQSQKRGQLTISTTKPSGPATPRRNAAVRSRTMNVRWRQLLPRRPA
jgi:hypothetical protein